MVDCPYNVHYKAYQSLEPCTSIYLKQKWDKAGYEKYVQRILLAKVSFFILKKKKKKNFFIFFINL